MNFFNGAGMLQTHTIANFHLTI